MRAFSVDESVVLGHLMITLPVIVMIALAVPFGLFMFGPALFLYYVSGGLALGWQWYSMALPRWKEWVTEKVVHKTEVERLARHVGLTWPGASIVGPFAFHTTAVAICVIHLSPWLVGRWFVWMRPLTGVPSSASFPADYYLQHLELISIAPAFAVGYIISRSLPRLAMWVWILPTTILAYQLLTFTDPHASVLVSDPWNRFAYFFVTERLMPIFPDLRGSDPVRVVKQMTVVAPFYGGMAYSLGALAAKHSVLGKFFTSSGTVELGTALPRTEEAVVDASADQSEKPVRKGD